MKAKIFLKATMLCIAFLSPVRGLFAQTVTVDGYFNQETKKDENGQTIRFHYTWDDIENSGFSKLGSAFKQAGAEKLQLLAEKPNANNLKGTDVFIIVDPDNLKDNPKPNYIDAKDASEISNWVKAGGILFIMANDSANCDLDHLNLLAEKFGIHFNKDLILHVTDDAHFSDGGLNTTSTPLFKTAKRIFLKDVCSITVQKPAQVLLQDKNGANVLVSAKYGKGTVLAVGDPWLYNEYTNGRLPLEYENEKAALDVATWLIGAIPAKK